MIEKFFRSLSVVALLAMVAGHLMTAQPVMAQTSCTVLGFDVDGSGNSLAAGTILDNEWSNIGITITTNAPATNPIMVFDTANPTGQDEDLGTPNSAYGGPGISDGSGDGGASNMVALGNAAIISEDNDPSDPDDNKFGGDIIFTFDQTVLINWVDILDIDSQESQGFVQALDIAATEVFSQQMAIVGDNSYQRISPNVNGVKTLIVEFTGSGAVPQICYTPQTPTAVQLQDSGVDTAEGIVVWLPLLVVLGGATLLLYRRQRERFFSN